MLSCCLQKHPSYLYDSAQEAASYIVEYHYYVIPLKLGKFRVCVKIEYSYVKSVSSTLG